MKKENLICGDLHGNYAKAKAFLDYKPEANHYFTGDILDSFIANDNELVETFKLVMNSDSYIVWGNHELHYLKNAHNYMRGSGMRENYIFTHLVETYKDKFKACHLVDNYLLTHGGLSKLLGKNFETQQEACDWINSEMDWYINQPIIPESLSPIFDIGSIRGGHQQVSGIFWLTFNYEKYDKRFNIICGHTPSDSIRINNNTKYNTKHVCVDTKMFHCYNTTTEQVEDFMPEEYKTVAYMLEKQY